MSNQITTEIVLVTPETAERWLGTNVDNRSIRPGNITKFARDMQNGRWKMTGEAIKFDSNGRLADGQHRLLAVVKSGVAVLMLVIRGLEPEAKSYMDSGSARTPGDALKFRGESNTTLLAATARLAIADRAGVIGSTSLKVSHADILEWVDKNPFSRDAAAFASRYARRTDVKPSMVSYAYLKFTEVDAQDAVNFWVAASEKVGLRHADPVIAMTNRFAEARRAREQLGNDAQLSLIYRAWNYRRAGKQWKSARVNSPGKGGGLIPVPDLI